MKTLYISDLDGTLLAPNGLPSEFTEKTVNSLVEKGMMISVSTSRSVNDAKDIFSRLHFRTPVITMNGAFINDFSQKDNAVYHSSIDKSVIPDVIKAFESNGCCPNMYTFADGDISIQYRRTLTDIQFDFVNGRRRNFKAVTQVGDFDRSGDVVFFSCIGDEESTAYAASELSRIKEINCTRYIDIYYPDSWYVEVSASGANKATALRRLIKMTGCDRVVVFGDNHNDLPMFELADEAIAVGNARESVKSAASRVILPNSEDGVAKYLLFEYEKYCKA